MHPVVPYVPAAGSLMPLSWSCLPAARVGAATCATMSLKWASTDTHSMLAMVRRDVFIYARGTDSTTDLIFNDLAAPCEVRARSTPRGLSAA